MLIQEDIICLRHPNPRTFADIYIYIYIFFFYILDGLFLSLYGAPLATC